MISSFCHCGGCVDVKFVEHGVRVRGSDQETDEHVFFSVEEWEAFVKGVKAGEFDVPERSSSRSDDEGFGEFCYEHGEEMQDHDCAAAGPRAGAADTEPQSLADQIRTHIEVRSQPGYNDGYDEGYARGHDQAYRAAQYRIDQLRKESAATVPRAPVEALLDVLYSDPSWSRIAAARDEMRRHLNGDT